MRSTGCEGTASAIWRPKSSHPLNPCPSLHPCATPIPPFYTSVSALDWPLHTPYSRRCVPRHSSFPPYPVLVFVCVNSYLSCIVRVQSNGRANPDDPGISWERICTEWYVHIDVHMHRHYCMVCMCISASVAIIRVQAGVLYRTRTLQSSPVCSKSENRHTI